MLLYLSMLIHGSVLSMANPTQVTLASQGWRAELSKNWDVLGPFPIYAREQHFLSPSFPLNLSEPIDFNKTWPSSYADGGRVSWSTAQSEGNGDLKVSFPNIRWNSLRATEGWAALQHHAVLRTSLTIYPPHSDSPSLAKPPLLLVHLIQGSYFAVIPSNENRYIQQLVPEWHSGDIYAMERALPRVVNLPYLPSTTSPTKYDVLVSGDYEIRLFGDPRAYDSEIPIQSINLTVDVENSNEEIVREPTQDIICDFVDGFAFGEAIGIGIRSSSGWWTVKDVVLVSNAVKGLILTLLRKTRIAPTQTRIIPVLITQTHPFDYHELRIDVTVTSGMTSRVISVSIPIVHHPRWTPSDFVPIKVSYFYMQSMPTAFLALPPILENFGEPRPPVLALHGAGVDILGQLFWVESLPRNERNWVVMPTGRTSWGLDWHGPSAQDAWQSLDAIVSILEENSIWHPWKLTTNTSAVVMGHSNGGQGAWYLASRYPDRVIGVVPAAGYIKSQNYVPLTMSRSAHFIDPALRAILESSLTPDDNDLFLSNLVDIPVLAVHGGADNNVPVWHSREAVSILQTWRSDANVTFREDAGQGHWYPSVLNNEQVQAFLDRILTMPLQTRPHLKSFTLTVSVPAESQALHGWRIETLTVPGRLARLHVETAESGAVRVATSNVNSFSINSQLFDIPSLSIDGSSIQQPQHVQDIIRFKAVSPRMWRKVDGPISMQLSGRMQAVLTSAAPIILVIPDDAQSQELSVALRIAHELNTYHRLDAEIMQSAEALQDLEASALNEGNIVVIGNSSSPFVHWTLNQKKTPFQLNHSQLALNGLTLDALGLGILFLHPHPTNPSANMLFILSTDSAGLENAARLFPIRTGVTVPDWLVIGDRDLLTGAAGIVGAGVWGKGWSWNEPMSWLC